MNIRNIFLCAFLLLTLSGCESFLFYREHENFVKVKGTHFTIGGKPYYYAGTNLWYGCYLGSPGRTGDRKRLLRELDTLQAHGITNLRILAASEESYLKRAIVPALQRAPGIVDDSLVEGLDFLLAEMAKRRMRAVLFLTNYWEWSGGMAQYMAWATDTIGADPEDPQKGYLAFMDYSARFYSTPKAVRYYLDYVHKIVTRKNSVNGRMYAEDPAIMAWQLSMNRVPGLNGRGILQKQIFRRIMPGSINRHDIFILSTQIIWFLQAMRDWQVRCSWTIVISMRIKRLRSIPDRSYLAVQLAMVQSE